MESSVTFVLATLKSKEEGTFHNLLLLLLLRLEEIRRLQHRRELLPWTVANEGGACRIVPPPHKVPNASTTGMLRVPKNNNDGNKKNKRPMLLLHLLLSEEVKGSLMMGCLSELDKEPQEDPSRSHDILR